MSTKPDGQEAFTLVELLVVLAIVTVLTALLLPAFKGAQSRAKTARCANNERQLGGAFTFYLNDHNGYYMYASPECPYDVGCPPLYYSTNYCGGQSYCGTTHYCTQSPDWLTQIAKYLGGLGLTGAKVSSLLQCSANHWPVGPLNISYGVNLDVIPQNFRPISLNGGVPCNPKAWFGRPNIAKFTRPAAGLLLGERPACNNINSNPWGLMLPFNVSQSPNSFSSYYVATNLCTTPLCIYDWLEPDCNVYVSAFHNSGMNSLFLDGHVGRTSKATLIDYAIRQQAGPATTESRAFWSGGYIDNNGAGLFGTSDYPTWGITE